MSCEWSAAVLEPRSLASHPNFSDKSWDRQPIAKLASRLAGEPWRWRERIYVEASVDADPDVELALSSFIANSQRASVMRLLRRVQDSSMEIEKAVPFALLAFAGLAEMEEYDALFEGVRRMHERVAAEAEQADAPLYRALLHQQCALRLKDLRLGFLREVEASVENIKAFRPDRCEKFSTAPGVEMSSRQALRRIKKNLQTAAAALVPVDPTEPERSRLPNSFELIRKTASPLAATADRQRASLLDKLLDEASVKPELMEDPWPIDNDLYFVHLQHEFMGHGWVYGTREHVAQLRILSSDSELSPDVLVFLRQAQNEKLLEQILQRLREVGPLSALSVDARRVIEQRLGTDRLSVMELKVLAASAELLSPPEASAALDAVFAVMEAGGPRDRTGQWSAHVVRQEVAWDAACMLANSSSRITETVRYIVEDAIASTDHKQLLDRSLAKVLEEVDWEALTNDLDASSLIAKLDEFPLAANVLRGGSKTLTVDLALPPQNLEDVRRNLNDVILHRQASLPHVTESEQIVAKAIDGLLADAAQGSFSYGGADAGELAVGLIIHAGSSRLWEPLGQLLSHQLVPHLLKQRALLRLCEASVEVPPELLSDMRQIGESLLQNSPMGSRWLGREITPFPAMLRFLGRHSCLEDVRIVSLLALLVAQGEMDARREAARSVSFFAQERRDLDLSGMALALSTDVDLRVRSRAAMALNIYSAVPSIYQVTLWEALHRLLGEDGLLAPLWMLTALRDSDAPFGAAVAEQVDKLASEHPSRVVRGLAESLKDR